MKKILWLRDNRDNAYRGYIKRDLPRGGKNDFTIRKMKNTTRFKIGQSLSADSVDNLLTRSHGEINWEIIVEGK